MFSFLKEANAMFDPILQGISVLKFVLTRLVFSWNIFSSIDNHW
uniref:Uncharacterized protein n=1 Tax=Arundo donax TaxID=35708 RepID=A0A0A9B7V2_ARUDO